MTVGNQIDLGSLCLIILIVVSSYGLGLILALTCWNAFRRHRAPDITCARCLYPPAPPGYNPIMPQQYTGLPQYSAVAGVMESHTADDRLGFLAAGAGCEGGGGPTPFSCDNLLSSSLATKGDFNSNNMEEILDRNTTISRSFRSSSFQNSHSSPFQQITNENERRPSSFNESPRQTLNARFGAITATGDPGNANADKSKMSQVRVLTSPPPSEDKDLVATSASRTPSTARENFKMRSQFSSRRSLKPVFSKSVKKKSPHVVVVESSVAPVTTETNLDTTEDDVFLDSHKRSSVTNVNSDQELRSREWTQSRKQRKVGSPGRTGNADFFVRQVPLRSFDIDIGAENDRAIKTDVAKKTQRRTDQRGVASAPQQPIQSRCSAPAGGAKPKDNNMFLRPPSLRKKSRHRAYKPGYSESEDVTDFSADEERRNSRRTRLQLPQPRSSPGSGSSTCGDVSVTPPPPASTDVSPDPSPLGQYSPGSFTQSDMDLVTAGSPSAKTSEVVTSDMAQNSEAASLQWDDYDHEAHLSFNQQNVSTNYGA